MRGAVAELVAHVGGSHAVREPGWMPISGDYQGWVGKSALVEPAVDDDEPAVAQTLHDLLVGEPGAAQIAIDRRVEDDRRNPVFFPPQLAGAVQDDSIMFQLRQSTDYTVHSELEPILLQS